jgi:hypothetical protein
MEQSPAMASVTRFSHYHQAENVLTNHVMVLLRTLYKASPNFLAALLQAVCTDEVTVGPRCSQQIVGSDSVPDGLILQEPLAVFVETKLGSAANPDQLQRHCQTIVKRLPGRKGNFLISLTSGQAGQQVIPKEVAAIAREHKITVVAATFGELVTQIAQLNIADLALQETLQEFSDFISAQGLVPREDQFMAAMLTGTSWQDNAKYGVYYEPVDRSPKWQRASFLGLYHNKHVSHIGRIVAVVSAMQNDNNEIVFDEPEKGGEINAARKETVQKIIKAPRNYYPELGSARHRYYLVDAFSETTFTKRSPGGMMGHRYFDIEEIRGEPLAPESAGSKAAQALDGRSFD